MKKLLKNTIFLSVCGLLAVLTAWIIAFFVLQNEKALPSPWATAQAAVELLGKGGFYLSLLSTLVRAVVALSVALLFGVGLAVVAYLRPTFEKFLRGIVAVLRALPTMAAMLLHISRVSLLALTADIARAKPNIEMAIWFRSSRTLS